MMLINTFTYSSAVFFVLFTYIIIKNKELGVEFLNLFVTIFVASIGAYFVGMQSVHIKNLAPEDLNNYSMNLKLFILIPYLLSVASITAIIASKTEYYRKNFQKYAIAIERQSKLARYRLIISFLLIVVGSLTILLITSQ